MKALLVNLYCLLAFFLVSCDGDPLFNKKPEANPGCFVQVERKVGWEQQEITCNYRPDSVTHEFREFKYLDSVTMHDMLNDSNPFTYHPRRRF